MMELRVALNSAEDLVEFAQIVRGQVYNAFRVYVNVEGEDIELSHIEFDGVCVRLHPAN